MKTKKLKSIKAWAVVLDGDFAHYLDEDTVSFYRTNKRAKKYYYGQGYEIIPVKIVPLTSTKR